jgi:hypothetical protein
LSFLTVTSWLVPHLSLNTRYDPFEFVDQQTM